MSLFAELSRRNVLRMAGLYGPGRIPRQSDLAQGLQIPARPDAYLNLIHIDDAAQAVCAAADHAAPSDLYVVSDGCPVLRRDFYGELARLTGSPPPTFAELPSSIASDDRRTRTDDKRVSNRRMLAELAVQLEHPTYRDGLASILAAGRS